MTVKVHLQTGTSYGYFFAEKGGALWTEAWNGIRDWELAFRRPRAKRNENWRLDYQRTTHDAQDRDPCPICARSKQSGETWQYMGTCQRSALGWVHEFRHRWHPLTATRQLVSVPATYRLIHEATGE